MASQPAEEGCSPPVQPSEKLCLPSVKLHICAKPRRRKQTALHMQQMYQLPAFPRNTRGI